MKKRKLLLMILCVILSNMTVLTSCAGKEKETEMESKEAPKDGETKQEITPINLHDFTKLEVITDHTQFTPATQDQSYHPETDMNQGCTSERRTTDTGSRITDTGSSIYMSWSQGGLFAFQKESATAGIACSKPDCAHDVKTVGGDCQANLRVLDAEIGGIQYYNGNFYYTLADGASILYKTSLDHEIKSPYVTLLGEKGHGICSRWMIHRGYIYFYVESDGIYKMSADNPSNKELLIDMSQSEASLNGLFAEGSYLYFTIWGNGTLTVARYNMETNQIEQLMDTEEVIWGMLVHGGKLYYVSYSEDYTQVVYCYDAAAGKKEIFLQAEDVFLQGENEKNIKVDFWLLHGDLDYIYIKEYIYESYETMDYYYYDGNEELFQSDLFLAYTWDKTAAGEILNTKEYHENSHKPFDIFSKEETELVGSDNDRIYYLSRQWDIQVQENGILEKVVEGTEKTVISYINKSEISAESAAPVHIAGEIYD